jgi:hypothetical protein
LLSAAAAIAINANGRVVGMARAEDRSIAIERVLLSFMCIFGDIRAKALKHRR